jgi:hypothetical protein
MYDSKSTSFYVESIMVMGIRVMWGLCRYLKVAFLRFVTEQGTTDSEKVPVHKYTISHLSRQRYNSFNYSY